MSHWTPGHQALDIAVIGSGISGLSAAWLLAQKHRVTVFESERHLGGHSNTVEVSDGAGAIPVDTGFIVYNAENYPNLVALFNHLKVPTTDSDMSFAASLRDGALEYAGSDLRGLFAQPANLMRGRFWRMLGDLYRFYRAAPSYLAGTDAESSIGDLLTRLRYSDAFCDDHLLPMAGAIWSATAHEIKAYPARAFLEFFRNHGLLRFTGRPQWRSIRGGAREYVRRLCNAMPAAKFVHQAVKTIERSSSRVTVTISGDIQRFDHVVVATHADQALRLLGDPSHLERRVLSAFRYARNRAILHEDPRLMPQRRRAWASWNYLERNTGAQSTAPCVTYWMNRLQELNTARELFVTLNPSVAPRAEFIHDETFYEHPQFNLDALHAQQNLWRLQGVQRTWYCGSYCGYGFHEDGLQAGLSVAEQLGGSARPWPLPAQVSRIHLAPAGLAPMDAAA